MQIKSDCGVMQNTTKVVNALHLFLSQIHSVHLIYGSMESIYRSSCACRLCKYVYKINVSNQEPWKVGYIYWSKYFALQGLHGTIGHEAVYTSLWLGVSLAIPLSMACSWKKRLVHVRIHYSVWKVVINTFISLNVQVLVFVSSLEYLPNLAATSTEQHHSREDFVQNECYKIQKWN